MSKRITTLMSDETIRQIAEIAGELGYQDRKRFVARVIERAVEQLYLSQKGMRIMDEQSPDQQPHMVVKTVSDRGTEYRCPICGKYDLVPASGQDAGKTIPIIQGNSRITHIWSDNYEIIGSDES
jgi:hypothetical protein